METGHPTMRPVRPSDCALALAIPLTREQFLDDLVNPSPKDFASHIKRENRNEYNKRASDDYFWNEVYGPLAHVILRVCAEVEKLGVTVQREARLADLTRLLREYPAVTLVAHWRFTKVLPSEVTDAHGLLGLLQTPQNRIQRDISKTVAATHPRLFEAEYIRSLSAATVREELAELINRIISVHHAFYHGSNVAAMGIENGFTDPLDRLTRVAFEQAFPSQFTAGRCVEFSDGLRTVAEVTEAVPEDFSGLLDLTVCNSVILAKAIRQRRSNCLIAANRYPAQIHVRLGLYKIAIEILAKNPMPMIEVLNRVQTRQSPSAQVILVNS